jgi:hypothetical protein
MTQKRKVKLLESLMKPVCKFLSPNQQSKDCQQELDLQWLKNITFERKLKE